MHLLSAVLIGATVYFTDASWINDLTSSKGLHFGDGISLRLEDNKSKNSSFFERLSLRLDNENMGISLGQKAGKKAVELDFYVKDKSEGRGKKMGNMVVPFIMGAAGAGAMSVAIGGVKMMTMKALMVAKLALIFSIILLVGKLMKEKGSSPRQVEIEHSASEMYPMYAEYPHSGGGNNYHPSGGGGYGGGGYGGYSYGPSGAESVVNYATVEAPGGNGSIATIPVVQPVVPSSAKRREYRRKSKPIVVTITHITQPEKDGLL